ncbi:MAG: AbgT family transporter [Thermomicrobiales bacterium]
MSAAAAPAMPGEKRTLMQKILDGIERVGNKVPHPVIIFVYLIVLVIVLSAILAALGVSVTEQKMVPVMPPATEQTYVGGTMEPLGNANLLPIDDFEVKDVTVSIRSLLTIEGIRFLFTSFVGNFASFSVVSVIFVAMIGVGVAEEAGMMAALIRKLVAVTPGSLLTFVIVLVGGLSSVATDAGYLILIPLGAAAFLSVGRHPIAGVAAAFAGVSVAFSVNILFTPLDAMLTEMTNEAIGIAGVGQPITITANWFFNVVSTVAMAVVATIVTTRMIEPRLGVYQPEAALGHAPGEGGPEIPTPEDAPAVDEAAEARGLSGALRWFLAAVAIVLLITLPPGAPLRDPETGGIVGNTPFMDSLVFIITLVFLCAGIGYGRGAGTIKSSVDIVAAVTKTFAGLGGLVLVLLVISQFIAYFNYTNMPDVIAGWLANLLGSANVNEIVLLIGLILIIALLDIIIPAALPKWAIFAPIFVPLFIRLGVAPQTVQAAYRIGDSPMNVITPLMVYFPFIVLVAQKYDKKAGLGTIIALMLPYTFIVLIAWIILFVIWYLLGIPVGPGYPVFAS